MWEATAIEGGPTMWTVGMPPPNAGKRGYSFYCQSQHSLPLISFFFTFYAAEEKEPYEAKARQDKKRYKDELSGYKNPQPMNIDSGNESDSE